VKTRVVDYGIVCVLGAVLSDICHAPHAHPPHHPQVLGVVAFDLGELGIARRAVIAVHHQPVLRLVGGVDEPVAIDRHLILGGLCRDGKRGQRCARYRGARSDASYSGTTTHCVLLAVSKPCPSAAQIALATAWRLGPDITRLPEPRKGSPAKTRARACRENGKRQGPSSRLDIRGLYHLRPGQKLCLD